MEGLCACCLPNPGTGMKWDADRALCTTLANLALAAAHLSGSPCPHAGSGMQPGPLTPLIVFGMYRTQNVSLQWTLAGLT